MAKFEVVWEAPEFEYRDKDVSWYWISMIVAALMIAFAVWQKDFLFGFFIVVAEILFIVWGNREPRVAAFTLTDEAIDIGGYKSHAMREFESWSADETSGDWAELSLYFRAHLRTPLTVILPEDRLPAVRAGLRTVLREIPHDPTLIETIEKFLHF